jgi:hypothetical protein
MGGRVRSRRRALIIMVIGLLAACDSKAGPASQNNTQLAAKTPAAPALPAGLTASEAAQIGTEVQANLMTRQFSWQGPGWGEQHLCTEVFDVGQPKIVDASLGPQSGRIQVVVPITGQRPYSDRYNTDIRGWFPSRYCYGTTIPEKLWSVGLTVPVAFQYNVEHWQTGWRLSQNQGQGGGL